MNRSFVGDKRMEVELHHQRSSDQFVASLWPTRYTLYSTLYYRPVNPYLFKNLLCWLTISTTGNPIGYADTLSNDPTGTRTPILGAKIRFPNR